MVLKRSDRAERMQGVEGEPKLGVNRRALKETQPGTAVIEPNGDETQ
jgi:hypothetical protein